MSERFVRQLEELHVELITMGSLCEKAISLSAKAIQCSGDGSQVTGYRMLMKKKFHTEIFDLSFLRIDLFFCLKDLANESHPAFTLNSFGRK